MTDSINYVTVRWFDGYREEFEAIEVRFGSDLLFLRLTNGKNRHIPLREVRWFGLSNEDHQSPLGFPADSEWDEENIKEC